MKPIFPYPSCYRADGGDAEVVMAQLQGVDLVHGHFAIDTRSMNTLKKLRPILLLCALAILLPLHAQAPAQERDGQRDFDFEIGTWKTHLKRRLRPLTGSTTWVEMNGTSVVSKVWNGRGNLVELEAEGPDGARFQGLSLRLYNPEARQWSLNFSNATDGIMTPPTIGEFKDGRGEFFAQETLRGRAIFVRFVITKIDVDTIRFEQAFSDDGGKTWEVNWMATDSRVKDGPSAAH